MLPEQLSQIKEANDIVEVISSRVPLKRSGRNYKALCPFHPDKEPSFYVSPERQTFRCFGCGAAGDIIAFVMQSEGLVFPDAVRMLANRAGIEIKGSSKAEGKTAAIISANDIAVSFYHKILFDSSEGAAVLEYLKKRNIPQDLARKFKLGYAPDSWQGLLDFASTKGINKTTLFDAGLSGEKDGRYYDFFRKRLIFPIFDPTGRVVAFGGRVLDDSLPKYINTKETPLFKKSSLLYGFNFARPKIFESRTIVVTEGYTDVMRAHEKGFTQVVATLGTALTEDHSRLIKRYADTVIVLFDADSAGKKAATRGVDILLTESLNIKVAQLPAEKDLCDYLGKFSAAEFEKVLSSAEDIFEFSMRITKGKHDLKTVAGTAKAVEDMVALIKRIADKQAREIAIDRISLALGVNRRDVALRAGIEDDYSGGGRTVPRINAPHRDMDIIDIIFSRPDLIKRVSAIFPPETFGNAALSEIAKIAYKTYAERGSLSSEDIVAKDEKLREKLLAVFEYSKDKGERDYENLFAKWVTDHKMEKMRVDARIQDCRLREIYERKKKVK